MRSEDRQFVWLTGSFLFATAIFIASCFTLPSPHYYAQRSLSAPAVRSAVLIRPAIIFVISDGGGNYMMVQRYEMTDYYSGAKSCLCVSDCTGCPKTLVLSLPLRSHPNKVTLYYTVFNP